MDDYEDYDYEEVESLLAVNRNYFDTPSVDGPNPRDYE